MIEDLAEVSVRLSGGFWRWRTRMLACRSAPLLKAYRAIYYLHQKKYGAFIGHSAEFTSEPCFPHNLNGIFIAGGAKIGSNCVIFHHVTIGANSLPFSSGVGSPAIGDNCRIGANCVVVANVPANSIVVAERARIITRDHALINRYYRWSLKGPIYFDEGKWILETDERIINNLKDNL